MLASCLTPSRHAVQLGKVLSRLHPDRDMLIVRLPVTQGCEGSYTSLCVTNERTGVTVDHFNRFVDRVARALDMELKSRYPLSIARLQVAAWTRSPSGVGRHKCVPSDIGGTHMATDTARVAFLQQVLHAVSLMSVDKPLWHASLTVAHGVAIK
jgi:hypothetical protein